MYLLLSVVLSRGTSWSWFCKNNVAQSLFHPYSAGLFSRGYLELLQFLYLMRVPRCFLLHRPFSFWGFVTALQISSVGTSAILRCDSSSIQSSYTSSENSTGFSGRLCLFLSPALSTVLNPLWQIQFQIVSTLTLFHASFVRYRQINRNSSSTLVLIVSNNRCVVSIIWLYQ